MAKKEIKIEKSAWLAPMAGVTDSSYRRLCKSFGAAVTVSEMVSAKALTMKDKKTAMLLSFKEEERPIGIQLFGYEPTTMAQAAKIIEEKYRPDFIDINMGCPTPKIVSNGSGSALMKSPELAAEIVAAINDAVSLPVTVKIRAGYTSATAPCLAPLLEQAGAAAIAVHGRTRDRMYKPPVDLDVIRDVKAAVSIPVIGNGDIYTPEQAVKMLEYTKCDTVMIGRGSLGNPFIFSQINAVLSGEPLPDKPTAVERMESLKALVMSMCEEKGERVALLEARKHAAWFTKGFRGASYLRKQAIEITSVAELDAFISVVLKETEIS